MSIAALKTGKMNKVVYNEINSSITELMIQLRDQGISNKMKKWVSRSEYKMHVNDKDWYGGFLQTCWSFGNNQKNYLYGKEIENQKRLLHMIIVERCSNSLKELGEINKIKLPNSIIDNDILFDKTIKDRYILFKKHINKRLDLQSLESLQMLQRLQRLQSLQSLQIINKSYDDVVIKEDINTTVIYLDPPYKNTAEYKDLIDYEKLYSWIDKSKYKIYMSSYNSHLDCVLEIKNRSTLSPSSNSEVIEKLFTNKINYLNAK